MKVRMQWSFPCDDHSSIWFRKKWQNRSHFRWSRRPRNNHPVCPLQPKILPANQRLPRQKGHTAYIDRIPMKAVERWGNSANFNSNYTTSTKLKGIFLKADYDTSTITKWSKERAETKRTAQKTELLNLSAHKCAYEMCFSRKQKVLQYAPK